MSDARHGRFEIDLDEIERQLRRSAEAAPAPKSDPLAELARIVGQDDPFSGLFAAKPGAGPEPGVRTAMGSSRPTVAPVADHEPDPDLYAHEEEAVLADEAGTGSHAPPRFDPVADAYGQPEDALEDGDFRPLEPRRSRRGLWAVVAVLVALVGGGAGVFAWRNGGMKLASSGGTPPIIAADTAPLKVAPENPGGMEIPNQDRQIYQRAAPEGRARVVDRQEQPLDVREVSRTLPSAPTPGVPAPTQPTGASAPPGTSAPMQQAAPAPGVAGNPVTSSRAATPGASPAGSGQPGTVTQPNSGQASAPPAQSAPRPSRTSAVQLALGEPVRVRTSVVKPDGTMVGGPTLATADSTIGLLPSQSALPPPTPVATVPITLGRTDVAPASTPQVAPDSGATPSGPAVNVLPPQRPRLAATDARPSATATPSAAPEPSAATPAGFTVQIGVRSTEAEARNAFNQAAGKYGEALSGRSPVLARAEVGGKTVYRVRVAASSRSDATALCEKLKAAGGQCYVAGP